MTSLGSGAERSTPLDAATGAGARGGRRIGFQWYAAARVSRGASEGGFMTVSLGYKLSSEEQSPADLVRHDTLPDSLPPLLVAVGGKRGAEQAARLGDGMIGTEPERALLAAFDKAGGSGKPRYAELTVCWAKDEATARRTAREQWPTSGMESSLSWELPLPDALRGGRQARQRGRGRGVGHVRSGSRQASRRHPQVRRRGLRPHLRPSGRPGPEGLLRVLRARDSPGAEDPADPPAHGRRLAPA